MPPSCGDTDHSSRNEQQDAGRPMTVLLGVDLGTTTITSLAVETGHGDVVARHTTKNDAQLAASTPGASEWDAARIVDLTCACLRDVTNGLKGSDIAGVGVTGQQHGVVIIDACGSPLMPFINWQDRRAEFPIRSSSGQTYPAFARALDRRRPRQVRFPES